MLYPDLPKPTLFHPLKHHLGYLQAFIQTHVAAEDSVLAAQLKTIGSSQLDLYLGKLPERQIASEILACLQAHHVLEPAAYRLYLSGSASDYQTVSLSDKSTWVLRWGVVAERHVHLHPARYSQHTIRVKANVLKTAIATSLAMKRMSITGADLSLINQVRTQWMDLAPLKHYEPAEGLGRLINLLMAFD